MILSVSRRTDIPNYYADWFLNRIDEGFLYVRNPMNPRQISRIELSPEVVDCIVFWTKNPARLMEKLEHLREYAYYFQFTLTGYGPDIEPNIPDKGEKIIPAFQELSRRIGKEKVIWRYDPIFINEKYTETYHAEAFQQIAGSLAGYAEKVVISFVDLYAKTRRNTKGAGVRKLSRDEILRLAAELHRIAQKYGLEMETCAEPMELRKLGISHGSCIDRKLVERIIGCRLTGSKDKNQREACGCFESVEVGTYDTCLSGCKYCYANFNHERAEQHVKRYDAKSPLLCGTLGPEDQVTERAVKSLREKQIGFFD